MSEFIATNGGLKNLSSCHCVFWIISKFRFIHTSFGLLPAKNCKIRVMDIGHNGKWVNPSYIEHSFRIPVALAKVEEIEDCNI